MLARNNIFLVILFFKATISVLFAQSEALKGKIIDADTQKPISYAHIGIEESSLGTVCNEAGEFILAVPSLYMNGKIQVTCVAYQTELLSIQQLLSQTLIYISLKPSIFKLPEIVINSELSAETIVKKMIKNIPQHYSDKPYEQIAFHRTTTQINGYYVGLTESLAEIYNGAYNPAYSQDKYRFLPTDIDKTIQMRRSDYGIKYDFNGNPGNGISSLGLLALKKDIIHRGFISKVGLKKGNYVLLGKQNYKNKEVYIVGFTPKSFLLKKKMNFLELRVFNEYLLYHGTLYIDAQNFAFLRIDISTANFSNYFNKHKNSQTFHISHFLAYEATIQFSAFNDKYYLHYIRLKREYKDYGWNDTISPKMVSETGELIVQDLNTQKLTPLLIKEKYGVYEQYDNVKIPYHHKRDLTYREDFWLNYSMPPCCDWIKIQKDLSKNIPLFQQFMTNSGKPQVSEEEKELIQLKHSKESQIRYQQINK